MFCPALWRADGSKRPSIRMSKYLLFLLAVSAFGQGQVGGVQQPAGAAQSAQGVQQTVANAASGTATGSLVKEINTAGAIQVAKTAANTFLYHCDKHRHRNSVRDHYGLECRT